MKRKIVGILVCTLLIASISNIMVVIGQTTPADDVGVTGIISPISSPAFEGIPLVVTVENFGTNNENNVLITIDIYKWDWTSSGWLYECTFTEFIDINAGTSDTFPFSDYWTPDFLAYGITGSIKYKVTACTQLGTDEDKSNNCKTVEITLDYWHDIRVTSITTCQALGFQGIDAIVENRGTFKELDLTAYAEIRAPSGALANIDIGGINLDEPLGGTKALDFDTFVFTEKGTYQIKICIPLAVDDLPGNNCKTVDVEIIDPGVLIDDLIDYFETFEPDDPPYGWYNHPHNCLTQAKGKIVSYLSIIPPGPESLKNNAIRKLGDFIDDVDALLADGLISYDEWYELTTAANQIIWLLSNCY